MTIRLHTESQNLFLQIYVRAIPSLPCQAVSNSCLSGLAVLGSLHAWQADRSVSAIPMVYFPLQQHTSLMSVYCKMACCHSPFDLFAIIVINSSISMVPLPSVSTSCSITSSSSGVGSCPSALITYNVIAQLLPRILPCNTCNT